MSEGSGVRWLRVEAQAFEIDAGDETSEYPQGGRGVKIAGTSVVAIEFVDKVGLGITHCLEPAHHCGAYNHRAISTVAGAPHLKGSVWRLLRGKVSIHKDLLMS